MEIEHSFPELDLQEVRRRASFATWLRERPGFGIFVILPVFLSAIYFAFIAPDIYVSESRFVVTSPDQKRGQLSTLANLVQTTGLSGGQEQANEVLDYVYSRDALAVLVKTIDVAPKLQPRGSDLVGIVPNWFSDHSFEDLYKKYQNVLSARLDPKTGLVVLKTNGYTSSDAYQINSELLRLSENLVNELNERARTKAISEAQRQVDLAARRAKQAGIALAQYRNANELLDPGKQGMGVITIANEMIAQRAALKAQLELMQRMTPANPSIPAVRDRINAISAQIASQNSEVVGSKNAIASKMEGYEALMVEQEFAAKSLTAANAALVQAESEAAQQQYYVARIVDPNKPDKAMLPHRFLGVIIVAAAALCLYFIGWMFVVGILEHAPEN